MMQQLVILSFYNGMFSFLIIIIFLQQVSHIHVDNN